jgi:alkylhydroperoxidase family enzyme
MSDTPVAANRVTREPLPLPDESSLQPLLTGAAAGLPAINVFRALTNAPSLAPDYLQYFGHLFKPLELRAQTERLVVLWTGKLSGCDYIWRQNIVVAKSLEISDRKIAELDAGNVQADCFTMEEVTAFQFVRELIDFVEVTDVTYAEAVKYFSPRAITEMLYVVGSYMFLARLIRTGRVPLDAQPAEVPNGFFG